MRASAIPELPKPTTSVRSRVAIWGRVRTTTVREHETKQKGKGTRGRAAEEVGVVGKPELTTMAGAGRERRRSPPLRAAMGDAAAATAAEVGEWQSGMGGGAETEPPVARV